MHAKLTRTYDIYVLYGSDLRWWVRNHSHQTMKVIGGTLESVGERGET